MKFYNKLSDRLNDIPPCFVRLLAKDGNQLAGDRVLMARTGWSARRLREFYQRARFTEGDDVDTFFAACGIRWSQKNQLRWQLQRAWEKGGLKGIARMRHLKPRNPWQARALNVHLRRIEKLLSQ